MYKLAIVGSRRFTNYRFMKEVLKPWLSDVSMIVSGGAMGADTLAQRLAKEYALPILIYYPDWDKYKKAAGVIRNQYIVDEADIMIAFAYNDSRGTRDSIKKMEKAGKSVKVIELGENYA